MNLSFQQDFQQNRLLLVVDLKEDRRAQAVVAPHRVYVGALVRVHESCQQILAFPVLAASLLRARLVWKVRAVC